MSQQFQLNSLDDTVEVAPGVWMNRLGLGTYRSAEGPEVRDEVRYALSIGYRLIDTAALYGNERGIGATIEETGLARADLFIATKVWNSDQGYESTLRAFDASLERLGMDYVDLYLVHWPDPARMRDTWRAMERILSSGRTRAIGVCNHLVHHLDELLSFAEVPPAVNQFEFHPWLQQPRLVEYCRSHGITVQAWAPIIRGQVNDIPQLVQIGDRHGKTPAQVSIRWILQKGIITIPKSVHAERIRENAQVFDFELSAEEVARIDGLDHDVRIGPNPDGYVAAAGKAVHPPK